MTGVGAAATADAHALGAGFYPDRDIKRYLLNPVFSTQCLGCDREGGCGHYPPNVARRAHRQFSADTGRARYHRSTAGADVITLVRCS